MLILGFEEPTFISLSLFLSSYVTLVTLGLINLTIINIVITIKITY